MRQLAILSFVCLPALLAGCADRVRPYSCCSDLNLARQRADLVVTGDATSIQALQHHMGPQVKTQAFGVIGAECVAEDQVTMVVDRVDKGTPPGPSVIFRLNSPCFHPAKGFALVYKAPAVLKGDHLTAYLANHGGIWWLIAHELENAPSQTNPATGREQIYTGDYSNWPP